MSLLEQLAAVAHDLRVATENVRGLVDSLSRRVVGSSRAEGALDVGGDMQAELAAERCGVCGEPDAEPVMVRAVALRTGEVLEVAVCASCARLSPHLLGSRLDDRRELARRASQREEDLEP